MEKTTVNTAVRTWNLDHTHSNIHFAVRHMVISETKGAFEAYKLKVQTNGTSFEDAKIELEIDVNSITTNMVDRDNHLRSADFFDAAKFPVIRFVSTAFEKIDDETYKLSGDLTIKDITKPIEFKLNYGGQVVDPWGNLRAGFHIEGTIDRFEYGLTWNSLLETGGAVVAKKIRLEAGIEVIAVANNG
jgi:polyisoprenoid-binding protein YceI